MRHVELTVKEYARKERVTERTVWTWIAKGAVSVRRTPGAGVRILDKRDDHGQSYLSAKDGPVSI